MPRARMCKSFSSGARRLCSRAIRHWKAESGFAQNCIPFVWQVSVGAEIRCANLLKLSKDQPSSQRGDIPKKAPRDASISLGMPLPVRSAHATVSPLNITGNEALEFPMMTSLELGELVNFSVASIPFHWRSEGVIPSVTIR